MQTTDRTAEKTFEFRLVYRGPTELTQGLEDAIFEAGCGDALLGIVDGLMILDFDRRAASLRDALFSAINDIERSGLAVDLVRFESA